MITYLYILALFAAGCQSDPQRSDTQDGAGAPSKTASSVAAYINSTTLTRDALYDVMVQSLGGQALAELLLDQAIPAELKRQGLALTDAEIQAERDLLLNSLSDDADTAARLLNQMREQRGLGKPRFDALLRRNAGLRKLVGTDQLTITPQAVKKAYDLRFGTRYRVRLITGESLNKLSAIRAQAIKDGSFTELAIKHSTDPSRAQGGLLSPISPADDTYPVALRRALPKLSLKKKQSRISAVIALPSGYALLWLEEVITGKGPPLKEVKPKLERAVRLDLQRVLMQRQARSLIEQANIVILDPALERAWTRHRESILKP